MIYKDRLIEKYNSISEILGLDNVNDSEEKYELISRFITCFMNSHKRVAIYCMGKHTRRLMGDFISELRDVVAIVDNGLADTKADGFRIIKDEEIETERIDGIIVSSFMYMDDIKKGLNEKHPEVDVLDIYSEMRDLGIRVVGSYYNDSPYEYYKYVNKKRVEFNLNGSNGRDTIAWDLVKAFVGRKDFHTAISFMDNADMDDEKSRVVHEKLKEIMSLEMEAVANSDKNNVLILCLDGLRRKDFSESGMPKTWNSIIDKSYVYDRAYSYSTSTYESLIPAFSGNTDQRTGYYIDQEIPASSCRFMTAAKQQDRNIYIYGDGHHFIYDRDVKYAGKAQTLTEKIWGFVLDSADETNGLFYLHEAYETHYSFVNPYTENELLVDSRAMLFDYLPWIRGKLRADYESQHADSIRYLDDILSILFEHLNTRTVIMADHGSMVLDDSTGLNDIRPVELTAGEDLIRIPLVVISPDYPKGICHELMSLLDLNDIVISLLNKEDNSRIKRKDHIKIGRSEIYNPDFKYLYKKMGQEHSLLAFEGFLFEEGEKLLVFSDGIVELYRADTDSLIDEDTVIPGLFSRVREELTVCDIQA